MRVMGFYAILYENLNRDEDARIAYDGMLIHIAGGQRGDFNHRFAQPSVANIPGFGQRFPFAAGTTSDSISKRHDGLFHKLDADAIPKVIFSNTSWEYWRGDASLIHIQEATDLPEHRTHVFIISPAPITSGASCLRGNRRISCPPDFTPRCRSILLIQAPCSGHSLLRWTAGSLRTQHHLTPVTQESVITLRRRGVWFSVSSRTRATYPYQTRTSCQVFARWILVKQSPTASPRSR